MQSKQSIKAQDDDQLVKQTIKTNNGVQPNNGIGREKNSKSKISNGTPKVFPNQF